MKVLEALEKIKATTKFDGGLNYSFGDCNKKEFKIIDKEIEYAESCHRLEEEIGCPIEVVFKALKNGFYDEYRNWYREYNFNLIYNWLLSNPNEKYLSLTIEDTDFEFKLKDYKKTWWLREDKSE